MEVLPLVAVGGKEIVEVAGAAEADSRGGRFVALGGLKPGGWRGELFNARSSDLFLLDQLVELPSELKLKILDAGIFSVVVAEFG